MVLLQAAGATAVDVRDRRHATPLHAAARAGKLETVKWLIKEGGARLDAQDDRGATPLHAASFFGKEAIADWLLRHANDEVSAVGTPAAAVHQAPSIVITVRHCVRTRPSLKAD